jgi:hypothetical protein
LLQALAGSKIALHTAGGEFHPAPRTNPHTIVYTDTGVAWRQFLAHSHKVVKACRQKYFHRTKSLLLLHYLDENFSFRFQ